MHLVYFVLELVFKTRCCGTLSSGVDYLTIVVEYGGETVALQFWDTAGQERYAICPCDVTPLLDFSNLCTYLYVIYLATSIPL